MKKASAKTRHSLDHRSARWRARAKVRAARPAHIRFALHPLSLFLLLLSGVLIIGWTLRATAASYTVTAKVPAPPLTEGAVITQPTDGTVTTTSSIVVSGTCPGASYVKLTRNNLFSGVSACASDHSFTINTALSPGANTLLAQDYNITDDPGSATPAVTVHYSPPPNGGSSSGSTGSGSTAQPLLIASDYRFQAVDTGAAFRWIVLLKGGVAPYTLVIDWGDGGETMQTTNSPGNVTISHDYAAPGYFTIAIDVTDATGATTTLQLVAFVKVAGASGILFQNGTAATSGTSGSLLLDTLTASKWLLVAWPSYIIVVLMVASFWLGERQEIRQILSGRRLRTQTHRH